VNDVPVDIESFSPVVRRLWERMDPCVLCPRRCKVSRTRGQMGYCGIAVDPVVSSVGPHFGEESVLVGMGGSGTIFFAGCNLRCVFCQNYDISHNRLGRQVTIERLARAMIELQVAGCENVNLVTPSHVAAQVAAAIELARKGGLKLPIVYNTGGYDSVETLALLDGLVEIYMPDMKYADAAVAERLSDAPDYPAVNQAAVQEMHRQVGDLKTENGVATKGLLVRHLVLPGGLAGSTRVIDYLADEVSSETTINVMGQYRPCCRADEYPEIDHYPEAAEIRSARQYASQRGLRLLD